MPVLDYIVVLLTRSLQRLASAPWMLMESFDVLRFPARAPDVVDVARAMFARRAMAHVAEVRHVCGLIGAAFPEDEAFLDPPMRGFARVSLSFGGTRLSAVSPRVFGTSVELCPPPTYS